MKTNHFWLYQFGTATYTESEKQPKELPWRYNIILKLNLNIFFDVFVYFLKQYSDDNGIFNDLSMTLFDMLKCE